MKNNGVTIWDVRDLVKSAQQTYTDAFIGGIPHRVPARPLGWTSIPMRLKAVWMVWKGRADIVIWPGQ